MPLTSTSRKKIKDLFNPITNPGGGLNAVGMPTLSSRLMSGQNAPVDSSKLTVGPNSSLSSMFSGEKPVSQGWKDFGSQFTIGRGGNLERKPVIQPASTQGPVQAPAGQSGMGGYSPTAAPASAPAAPGGAPTTPPATTEQVPQQWMNPDGSMKTPEQVAAEIASTLEATQAAGDVGRMAASEFSDAPKTAAELRAEAALASNARNDIASGETDPFGIAGDSGIAYTPAELSAIESAYAGIYDPAIVTAQAKLEQKQAQDAAAAESANRMAEMDYEASLASEAPYTLSKDQVRYDADGNVIARGVASTDSSTNSTGQGGSYQLGGNPTVDSWVNLITTKRASIENAPQELRGLIAQGLNQAPNPQAGYILEQADEAVRSIDTIMAKISGETSGNINTAANPAARAAFGWFPGSDARDVDAARTTIEAIVGFDTLNKMRESAPSGASGLGQVTEKELKYLQSVQGSLDTGQSNEQLFETLRNVRASFNVIRAASAPPGPIPTEPTEGDAWRAPDNAIYEYKGGAWEEVQPGDGGGTQGFSAVGNTSVSIPQSSRLAYVNNNPGNLRFAGQQGASQGEGGFARFPSPEAGVQALQNQINLDASRNLTLAEFISKYAPPTENDTNKYIQDMVAMTGATPDTPISQIDLNTLTRAVAQKESSTNIG